MRCRFKSWVGKIRGEGIGYPLQYFYASLVAQLIKNLPSANKESACNAGDLGLIPRLGRSPGEGNGYPLQYSRWRIPWTEGPSGIQSMGSQTVGHDWATNANTEICWFIAVIRILEEHYLFWKQGKQTFINQISQEIKEHCKGKF